MGNNDFLTPKAISNRIKAKGLKKLKWYCQMCGTECRDANGFKCHCTSESHKRKMQLFGQNPCGIIDSYSEQFETAFLEHMKRSHRSTRVAATVVYNEYIADRHHVHMNATHWATLTEFVKYLGKEGKCKVEETPRGWFLTYRDPEMLLKDKLKNKRLKSDVTEEERQERAIQKQIEIAAEVVQSGVDGSLVPTLEPGQKIAFSLGTTSKPAVKENPESTNIVIYEETENEKKRKRGDDSSNDANPGKSALDELMKEGEKAMERFNRKDYWLCEGIIVKVMSKALSDKSYYNKKGVVNKVIDKYVGEIQMLDSKHVLRVDQAELETVLPQIGGVVKLVNGAYRGLDAKLLSVDMDNYSAKLRIEEGLYGGTVLQAVDYEDICKLAQ